MEVKNYIRKKEKTVLELEKSYRRWYEVLKLKVLRMFEWQGLPFPQRELELRLISAGVAPIIKKGTKFFTAWGGLYGVTEYEDVFTDFSYSAPTIGSGKATIGKNCEVCYANSAMLPIMEIVEKYASLLAHSDITLRCALVNVRHTDILSSTDAETREDVSKWYDNMYCGKTYAILDKSLLGNSNLENLINTAVKTDITELINAHNEILRCFYREIGVRWTRQKMGNMTEDELVNDDMMLLFNISDMLKCREDFCDKVNKTFGLEISVKLSSEYEKIEGDNYDGDN